MDEIIKSRLLAIKDRLESTTPGTWSVEEDAEVWELYAGRVDLIEGCNPTTGRTFQQYGHGMKLIKAPKQSREFAAYWPEKGDGEFIHHAKADIDFLLSLVSELEKQTK